FIWVADSGLRGTGSSFHFPPVPGQIIRVDRNSGNQVLFATTGYIAHPYGIAYDPVANFPNGMLYVSSFDNNAGTGSIVAINPSNGSQTLIWGPADQCAAAIASGNSPNCVSQTPITVGGQSVSLACPMGLTVDGTGDIVATTLHVPPYGCAAPGIFRIDLG